MADYRSDELIQSGDQHLTNGGAERGMLQVIELALATVCYIGSIAKNLEHMMTRGLEVGQR